jgi:sugar phosphate permease
MMASETTRGGVYYGWYVVGATFLTMLVMAGAVGAPGVLILPLKEEFGWQTSEISAALSIRLILFGLMAPFAAALMNRYGVRRLVLTALAIVTVSLLLSLAMTRLWQLIVLWGFAVGFGTGLTAMVLGATVATRWFAQRRGLVVGLLTASSATGQLVFLPLMAALTERFGWRLAVLVVCGLLVLAALVVAMLMRDRPSDLGLPAYGATEVQAAPPPPTGSIAGNALGALAFAARTPVFWVLFSTFFICGLSTNGLIQTHFVPLCADFGLPAVGAASVLALMGVFDFFGTILSGWLSDRYDNRWLLFWYYGLRGLSLLYLPFTDFTFYGLSLFAVFYGLDWIATVPPTVKLTAQRFGPERANLVFGWIFTGHQLGAGAAAFGAGWSRSALESYLPAFYVAGALCLVASLLVLTVRRPGVAAAMPRPA